MEIMTGRKIDVISYSGYRAEEIPQSFRIDNEKIDVITIIKSWLEEVTQEQGIRRFFRVKGSDGYIHVMYFDENSGEWFLSR